MSYTLRSASMRLIVFLCVLGQAQLACSAATGDASTPTPGSPEVEQARLTPLPAQPTRSVTDEPPPATAQAPSLPDRPLSKSGPWYAFMAFGAEHELWALNADGSGLTLLWSYFDEDEEPAGETFSLWPAPSGGRVAVLQFDRSLQTAPVLRLMELPSGDVRTIANLLPRAIDYAALNTDARSAATQVWAAVGPKNQPAWSSDGRWLAFNAAIDGPSADVYVYDASTDRISRLTDGPDQSTDLAWSPEDGYIVHSVARSLYYGFSGIGYDMLGAWAVPPDPSKPAVNLFNHAFLGFEHLLGWLEDGRYLGDSLDGESLGNCGFFGLRTVDILKGEGPELLEGHYSLRAFDPETSTALLVLGPSLEEFDCSTSLQPGVYLFDIASREASLVEDVLPDPIMGVSWSREAGAFFLGGGSELLAIDPAGHVTHYPSIEDLYDYPPIVGPSGNRWALANPFSGTVAVGTRSGQLIPIDNPGAQSPFWSPDESWLFFGDGLQIYAAPAPGFSPAIVVGNMLSAQAPVFVNP